MTVGMSVKRMRSFHRSLFIPFSALYESIVYSEISRLEFVEEMLREQSEYFCINYSVCMAESENFYPEFRILNYPFN